MNCWSCSLYNYEINHTKIQFYFIKNRDNRLMSCLIYIIVPTNAHIYRHSSPYCCWSLWWISADGTFSPMRNLITMRCSTLRGTFCSLITLATPRQDWTGSNPSRREGGGCGFTLWRSHSCCAVRLVDTQISPGHIWTTLYLTRVCNFGIIYCTTQNINCILVLY